MNIQEGNSLVDRWLNMHKLKRLQVIKLNQISTLNMCLTTNYPENKFEFSNLMQKNITIIC